jgi:formylglycine-generating enzyme required for sulfatase activity
MRRIPAASLIACVATACSHVAGPTGESPAPDSGSSSGLPTSASSVSSGNTGQGSSGSTATGSSSASSAPCTPQTTRCSANGVETCEPSGQWGNATACAQQACVDGGCTGVCTPGAQQCSGDGIETCGATGQWSDPWPCATHTCSGAACTGSTTTGMSCASGDAGVTNCGADGESCCTSLEVPGGTYYRTFDPQGESGSVTLNVDGGPTGEADPATVSGFRLDKYLVTVGRFRQYVNYVSSDAGAPPANGSGIHAHLNGGQGLVNSGNPGTYETGWDAPDWDGLIATGPNPGFGEDAGAASAWDQSLSQCLAYSTWTSTASTQENLPINCVDWYQAYAFCIWDGGYLPSEAEWEYAAAGGSRQLAYPWGSTDPGTNNLYAIYNCNYPIGADTSCTSAVNVAPVGTATLGVSAWGQLDMAGDEFEWNLDGYAPYVDPCIDCAYLSPTATQVTRGGNYTGTLVNLLTANRAYNDVAGDSDNVIGFRCARTP